MFPAVPTIVSITSTDTRTKKMTPHTAPKPLNVNSNIKNWINKLVKIKKKETRTLPNQANQEENTNKPPKNIRNNNGQIPIDTEINFSRIRIKNPRLKFNIPMIKPNITVRYWL